MLSIVPKTPRSNEESFLAFLADRSYSPQTLLAYEADLKDLQSYAPLGVQTVQQADGFVSFLSARGLSASSIHRKVSTARSFYDYLVRYDLAPRNVFTGTPLPRLAQRLPTYPTGDTVAVALANIPDNSVGIRDRALITLLFQAGLRISEAPEPHHGEPVGPGVRRDSGDWQGRQGAYRGVLLPRGRRPAGLSAGALPTRQAGEQQRPLPG